LQRLRLSSRYFDRGFLDWAGGEKSGQFSANLPRPRVAPLALPGSWSLSHEVERPERILKLPYTLHSLRHTHASALIARRHGHRAIVSPPRPRPTRRSVANTDDRAAEIMESGVLAETK
jgi:hypothetical protein